jgi:hypothetical protein
MYLEITILVCNVYIIYLIWRKVMPSVTDLNAAVDSLINSVQAEIKRVTVDLSNAKPTDSQGIQDAIGKLNNLSAQLDAVDPVTVAAGVAPSLTPSPSTVENPVVSTDVPNTLTSPTAPPNSTPSANF